MTTRRCFWCERPQLNVGSVPYRVVDVLESASDVAWTVRELGDRLDVSLPYLRRVLKRLASQHLIVEHRTRLKTRYRAAYRPVDTDWPPRQMTPGWMCSCGMFIPDPNFTGKRRVMGDHRLDHLNGEALNRKPKVVSS